MTQMKIRMEDYELVHSAVVIQIENYPIRVTLPDEIEGDYTFIFNFVTDDSSKEVVTRLSGTDKFHLNVDFVNFHKMTNGGNTTLMSVGTYKNLPLHLNYRVDTLVNVGKTLTLNFYIWKGGENAE